MVVNTADNRWATSNFIVAPTIAEGASYTTIAAALTAASSGNTIFIKPGTYTENLTLKAGVNLTAFNGDGNTPNVTIVGNATASFAGTCTLGNIRLQTNSAACLTVSGSAATIVNGNNCYLNCTNNTGISFSSSSASALINLNNCQSDLGTTGIALYSSSSAGTLILDYCGLANSGASTTASSNSAGSVLIRHCQSNIVFSTSSTGVIGVTNGQCDTSALNATTITTAGTGTANLSLSRFASGSASAISIGAGTVASLSALTISSTNTNPVTGAGSITQSGLSFSNTGSNVNVTSTTIRSEGPSRTIGSANTGATNTLLLTNSSNTASSNALQQVSVGGTSAGDPFTTYTVSGTTNWSHGIDNSVSGDPYVLSASTALGTTNVMSATTSGEVNWPLQPAFLAYLDADVSNVTGDGTAYAIVFDTEVFDQGSDFSSPSFTAPVSGAYTFHIGTKVEGVGAANTQGLLNLATSNRVYRNPQVNATACKTGGNDLGLTSSCLCDMDAGDTAHSSVTMAGGTKTVSVGGSSTLITYFSGNLTV